MQKYLQATDMELPENLSVVRQVEFNRVLLDFIADAITNEIYVFDEQVGVALEYSPPISMMNTLHDKHVERIEPYAFEATVHLLRGAKRMKRKTWLYSLRAICELCRWAKQPTVDTFLDFVWKEIKDIERKRDKPLMLQEEIIDRTAQRLADTMFPLFAKTLSVQLSEKLVDRLKGITDNQVEKPVVSIEEDYSLATMPDMLSVLHVKNYLSIGTVQAYEVMRSKGFPSFKVGGAFKLEKRKFIEWLDKKANEPRAYTN